MNTKERIFEAALTLFSQKGFNAVSIREITGETGLTVAAFYNHFKSKNELLQEIYDHYMQLYVQTKPDCEKLLDQFNPQELLAHLAKSYVQSMRNEKLMKLTRIILMEQYTNKTAGDIAFRDRQRLLAFMEELFAAMHARNLITAKDPRQAGKLMGYIYLGFASDNIYYSFLEERDSDEIVKEQTALVARFMKEIMPSASA